MRGVAVRGGGAGQAYAMCVDAGAKDSRARTRGDLGWRGILRMLVDLPDGILSSAWILGAR